jgi:hypothetical protein
MYVLTPQINVPRDLILYTCVLVIFKTVNLFKPKLIREGKGQGHLIICQRGTEG